MCDVPGPREEQESPSSLVGALRADLRKTAVGCQKRTRAGPKAGITSVTLSRRYFTSTKIDSRVEEALADAGFANLNLARCQFGLTPYTVAAEPKLRIAPYLTMLNE